MRFEIIQRIASVLLHESDDPNGVEPTSGLEVFQLGNIGICYSLRGAGFYNLLMQKGLAPFHALGLDTVLTVVTRKHLRAMKIMLKGVTIKHIGTMELPKGSGHIFEMIVIRDLEAETESVFAGLTL